MLLLFCDGDDKGMPALMAGGAIDFARALFGFKSWSSYIYKHRPKLPQIISN
jgi:hypothetical protein